MLHVNIKIMNKLKVVGLFVLIIFFSCLGIELLAQSITKVGDKYAIEISDEEKAIKASVAQIKAKTNYAWVTNVGTTISWKIEFFKDDKKYILYKNNNKEYETTTISGIKSKYASDLLGREVNIQ